MHFVSIIFSDVIIHIITSCSFFSLRMPVTFVMIFDLYCVGHGGWSTFKILDTTKKIHIFSKYFIVNKFTIELGID